MMGSDTDEATVYKSLLRHRNQEVRELIPSDQGGVMHTDRALTKDTIALWQRYHAGGVDDYTREAQNITQAIDRHLKPRSLDDPDNQRLLDQIGWHHAGGNLLPFLDQPEGAEPTNNRAERTLRPGVKGFTDKLSLC